MDVQGTEDGACGAQIATEADDARQGLGAARATSPHDPSCAVTFQDTLPSDPNSVRDALERLFRSLRAVGLTQSEQADVEIVLAEAMNNIVEHAYRGSRYGWLRLRTDLFPDCLLCRIEDGGEPMPNLEIPAASQQDLGVELADLPEGGFGWFMIRELTTELSYSRTGNLNRLAFTVQRESTSRN